MRGGRWPPHSFSRRGIPVKIKLVASKKFSYGRLRLREGQVFEVSRADARILLGLVYARYARVPVQAAIAPAPVAEPVGTVDIQKAEVPQSVSADPFEVLRAEFLALSGSAPDRRWGAARLTAEIAEIAELKAVQAPARDGDAQDLDV